MSEQFTVATANTYYGQLLASADGLKPFLEREVDAILLQEVIGLTPEELEAQLHASGYQVSEFDPASGLAIALREDGMLVPTDDQGRQHVIQPVGTFSRFALKRQLPFAQRMRPRKLITAELATKEGKHITLITAHPIVFMRARSRSKQVRNIIDFVHDIGPDGTIILGADMNHYPQPRAVDRQLIGKAGLQLVEIDEPTWRIKGSKHEWAGKIGSRAMKRELDNFDAQLDSMWFTHATNIGSEVIDIDSDHRAIISKFEI